jgi:hypothetical protein
VYVLIFIEERMKIKLNAGTHAVKRRVGSKGGSFLSAKSWPGELCSTLIDFSRELMDHVYDDPSSALCQWPKYAWSNFYYWNHHIG